MIERSTQSQSYRKIKIKALEKDTACYSKIEVKHMADYFYYFTVAEWNKSGINISALHHPTG